MAAALDVLAARYAARACSEFAGVGERSGEGILGVKGYRELEVSYRRPNPPCSSQRWRAHCLDERIGAVSGPFLKSRIVFLTLIRQTGDTPPLC